MWIDHPDTAHVIQRAWNSGCSLTSKIKHTKEALKTWNKHVFGNVHEKLKQVSTLIDTLQNSPPNDVRSQLERAALQNLTELETREAVLWKEKAKARWIEEGDANTHFFHVTTLIHRRHNHIDHLLTAEND